MNNLFRWVALLVFCCSLYACSLAPPGSLQSSGVPSDTPTPKEQKPIPASETPALYSVTGTAMPRKFPYQIVGYFPEWTSYTARDLEQSGSAGKLTVINYAFGLPRPNQDGKVVCTLDDPFQAYQREYSAAESVTGVADTPGQILRGHFNQLKALKTRHPELRLVISLGGWTGSGWFSVAASTEENRRFFAASCIDLFILGNLPAINGAGGPGSGAGVFDGIDIDWEYPQGGGLESNHSSPQDKENFTLLLQEFRDQYAAIGRSNLLLTTAIPAPSGLADQYGMKEANPLLDWTAVMSYDFRGAWSKQSGHHTNLCASNLDPASPDERLSADAALRHLQEAEGVPAGKLLIGAGFYGHGWSGVSSQENGLFQPVTGEARGDNNYRSLVQLLEQGFTRYWDDSAKAPWLYNPQEGIFWSYDDPQSLQHKARYARQNGLGGVMFWELTGDDDRGSLVDALYQELQAAEDQPPACQ
jgi:chitinase